LNSFGHIFLLTLQASFALIEYLVNCGSPLGRGVLTEDVIKVAGQGRYAVGHLCSTFMLTNCSTQRGSATEPSSTSSDWPGEVNSFDSRKSPDAPQDFDRRPTRMDAVATKNRKILFYFSIDYFVINASLPR
jgi:hypothetical protein